MRIHKMRLVLQDLQESVCIKSSLTDDFSKSKLMAREHLAPTTLNGNNPCTKSLVKSLVSQVNPS